MRKIILSVALTTFLSISAFAANSTSTISYKQQVKFSVKGTCSITYTAYNSAGVAQYSWTEYSYGTNQADCDRQGRARTAALNAQ